MATTNKNSMLPTYQGNYKDMIGALKAGDINSPCWMFLEDRNALAFIHWEKKPDGTKLLVPHVMLWDKVETLEEKVVETERQLEGLKDPETGEPIKVVDYVQPTIDAVTEIQNNGAAIMITSEGGVD